MTHSGSWGRRMRGRVSWGGLHTRDVDSDVPECPMICKGKPAAVCRCSPLHRTPAPRRRGAICSRASAAAAPWPATFKLISTATVPCAGGRGARGGCGCGVLAVAEAGSSTRKPAAGSSAPRHRVPQRSASRATAAAPLSLSTMKHTSTPSAPPRALMVGASGRFHANEESCARNPATLGSPLRRTREAPQRAASRAWAQ